MLSFACFLSSGIAFAYDDFSSIYKPISPAMASRSEMEAYREDLDKYVQDIDDKIAELLFQRKMAINQFNQAVHTYNRETVFHQDTLPLYPTWHHRRIHTLRPTRNDCTSSAAKTHEKRQQERVESFIDGMMDWGKE